MRTVKLSKKVSPGDFVRYIGHTKKCPGKDCEDLDFPFLIGKVMQVISTKMSAEDPGLMVEYGGNNYGFFQTHVELAKGSYDDGFEAGLEQAALLAESLMNCACGTCVKRIAEIIRNRASSDRGN